MNMQVSTNQSSPTARIEYVMARGIYTIPLLDAEKLARLDAMQATPRSEENQSAIDAFLDREYAMQLSGLKSEDDYLLSQALYAIPLIMEDPVKAEKLLAMQLAPHSEENRTALQAFLDLEYAMILRRH
jgi:hypothetical protein